MICGTELSLIPLEDSEAHKVFCSSKEYLFWITHYNHPIPKLLVTTDIIAVTKNQFTFNSARTEEGGILKLHFPKLVYG